MIKLVLTFLSFLGMWKPRGWYGIKARLYSIYQFIVLLSNYFTIISSVIVIETKNIDLEELFDNVSILLGVINARQKMSCLFFDRSAINYICDKLNESPFKPRDNNERIISTKFNGITRSIFICYMINTGAIMVYCGSRFTEISPLTTLPFKGWFPYNYSNPSVYWATAAYQVFSVNSSNIIDLVTDLLISSIMCNMCAQIHILKYRFNIMLEEMKVIIDNTSKSDGTIERKMIAEWVQHHIELMNLIKYINDVFAKILFIQYTMSSIILCGLSFLMSRTEIMTMTFTGYFGYFVTFNTQVFQQCYCAHTLTNESAKITTGIYNANWPSMSNNTRNSILIIMSICQKPISITSSFFITFSLEAYTKIVKLAYTIFNVLT